MKSSSKKTLFGLIGTAIGVLALGYSSKKLGLGDDKELASTPRDLSSGSWKKAFLRTKDAISNKNLMMLASAVAYGGTLAFFPLVVASVAIAGIVLSTEQINQIVDGIGGYLPSDIASLLSAQLTNALGNESANALVAVLAIFIALFGVSGAINSLVNALNIAYGTRETRNFVKVRLVSLALTCLMIVGLLIILPLIVLGGDVLRFLGLPELFITLFSIFRWVLLGLVMTLGLAVIYRYAPDRKNAPWQWVSWGAIMATILWLLVTVLFFVYVQNFSNFSDSYSLFAGIIVLMIWLNISALIVIIGAEVNHQLEKRTALDTEKL